MKAMKVIRREYVENVRRKSFIISTIVVPVIMSLFFILPVMFGLLEPAKQYRVAIVDETSIIGPDFVAALNDTLKNGERKYHASLVPSDGEAYAGARDQQVAALQSGDLDIVVAIPQGVITGEKASYITRQERNVKVQERFKDALNGAVLKQRLASEGLDYAHVRDLTKEVEMDMNQVTKEGKVEKRNFLSEYGIVFFFVILLYSSILSWGMIIGKSIVEEKGSRIIEVLLSALTARDLMIGKLVGVGAAGLTQLVTWAVVAITLTGTALPLLAAQLGPVHLPPIVFVFFVLFFLLGFMLFASIFMVIGAVSSTEQDVQQLQAVIMLPMTIPLLSLMLFMQDPNGGIAVGLSLVPVFTPLLMMARIILLMPPWWQIALGIGLMLLTILFAVNFAARVFRVGILMHGKRPSLRELIYWYRMAR